MRAILRCTTSLSPPIHTGIGRCTGSGLRPASGMRWCFPANVTSSRVHRSRIISICSSIRRPRVRKSSPSASNSTGFQPTATPSRSRPPESTSTAAACLATSAVWRCGRIRMPVTSSSRRATALVFAAAGAAVACADVEAPGARAIAGEIEKGGAQALPVHLDVTDGASCRAAVAATVERFGGLDVLLYGAADSDKAATVLEMEEAAWDRVIRVNLTGAFLMVKAAIPAMIARRGGSVILIASQLGPVAAPARPAYCATKGALIQLAKVLAVDHAAHGIRANTISPGAIETRRMLRRYKDMDEARKVMGPKHLLGRLGLPEEIARAALYLASDASAFMTGSDLLIDGGYTAI